MKLQFTENLFVNFYFEANLLLHYIYQARVAQC